MATRKIDTDLRLDNLAIDENTKVRIIDLQVMKYANTEGTIQKNRVSRMLDYLTWTGKRCLEEYEKQDVKHPELFNLLQGGRVSESRGFDAYLKRTVNSSRVTKRCEESMKYRQYLRELTDALDSKFVNLKKFLTWLIRDILRYKNDLRTLGRIRKKERK